MLDASDNLTTTVLLSRFLFDSNEARLCGATKDSWQYEDFFDPKLQRRVTRDGRNIGQRSVIKNSSSEYLTFKVKEDRVVECTNASQKNKRKSDQHIYP